ncbi:hypothetical protein A2501_00570 [Candidatus Uhrbacteria bacterium RIFOXYC12_FULL_57_11]|nr:MAG: hypothetical protein A2501_00570 [Candidatus Uhrbacteria bacterium RIFOXYC12_FULL_57_11]
MPVIGLSFMFVFAGASVIAWCFWPRLPDGLSRRTIRIGDREIGLLVYRLPSSLREYALVGDPSRPKSVRAWREELGADVVFNGSYFMEDGTPAGYWKTGKGTSVVPWPSPVEQADPYGYTFALSIMNGGLETRYLPWDPITEPVGETLLSFPTLVANGMAMVESDSGQLARRTAVAEDADGTDYLIVTERGTMSLFELSQWLASQPERFVIAGNLDGGPSAGVSIENNRQDIEVLSASVPNVVVIFSRLP